MDGMKQGAWSPGYMAQRSAMIHIASEDAQEVTEKPGLQNLTIMEVLAANNHYVDVKISPVETINAGTIAAVPVGTTDWSIHDGQYAIEPDQVIEILTSAEGDDIGLAERTPVGTRFRIDRVGANNHIRIRAIDGVSPQRMVETLAHLQGSNQEFVAAAYAANAAGGPEIEYLADVDDWNFFENLGTNTIGIDIGAAGDGSRILKFAMVLLFINPIVDPEDGAITAGRIVLDPFNAPTQAEFAAGNNNVRIRKNSTFKIQDRQFVKALTDSHVNFEVTIPNIIGYPEHKRCLLQVVSATFYSNADEKFGDQPDAQFQIGTSRQSPVMVGVRIQGLGVDKSFTTSNGASRGGMIRGDTNYCEIVGYGPVKTTSYQGLSGVNQSAQTMHYYIENQRDILSDGVLTSSPFGKRLRIQYLNMTTHSLLETDTIGSGKNVARNPTHLVLRLLVLGDDEIPAS